MMSRMHQTFRYDSLGVLPYSIPLSGGARGGSIWELSFII